MVSMRRPAMSDNVNEYIRLEKIIFKGKRNINWDDVELYLRQIWLLYFLS